MNKKPLGILLILIVVINLVVYALGKIGELLFWGTMIIIAVLAFWILPKLK